MSIIKDIRSIQSGTTKGRRDVALVRDFLAHPERWTCEQDPKDPLCPADPFWHTLALDIDQSDFIERAAYNRERDPLMHELIATYRSVEMVTFEIDGSEDQDEIIGKAMRAFETKAQFDDVVGDLKLDEVSETEKPKRRPRKPKAG